MIETLLQPTIFVVCNAFFVLFGMLVGTMVSAIHQQKKINDILCGMLLDAQERKTQSQAEDLMKFGRN
jgi:ABC-type uncharacterized transport system permease subunit